jgi:hypothetical protein
VIVAKVMLVMLAEGKNLNVILGFKVIICIKQIRYNPTNLKRMLRVVRKPHDVAFLHRQFNHTFQPKDIVESPQFVGVRTIL